MSVIMRVTFPAGRYHATPWGRHVNEGVPEWPPSPLRLLRALIAVWKRTCPDLSEAQIRRILEPLAEPPLFQLPRHRVAHTRHYMPWQMKGPGDRTLVFDTFVVIGRRDSLFVGWPTAELAQDDRAALSRLLANLSTLGRAESWVKAELHTDDVDLPIGRASNADLNPVPVLCPDPATAFGHDRYPTLDPKKLAKGKVSPAEFPFECPRWHLCLDTETIHSQKWPAMPGTKWVNYTRPTEASPIAPEREFGAKNRPTVARYLIDAPVLPKITDTLRVAEAFRRGLMGRYQRHRHFNEFGRAGKPYEKRFPSEVFSGKDEGGNYLLQHRHAFYLPTAEGTDGRWITNMTVVAEEGFSANEVAALCAFRGFKLDPESTEVRTQLVGLGTASDFRAPLLAKSAGWISATPFVATRHLKRRGQKRDPREFLESPDGRTAFVIRNLREELARRGFKHAEALIEPVDPSSSLGSLRPYDFRLRRSKRDDDGPSRPRGFFRLRFPEPVSGPIALGHSCHFGLGLFRPEADGSG